MILLLILLVLLFIVHFIDIVSANYIDIVSAKPTGEKSPLTKSLLRTTKSLVKSFTNNRNINTTRNNNRKITYKINNSFYIFRLRIGIKFSCLNRNSIMDS